MTAAGFKNDTQDSLYFFVTKTILVYLIEK